jgi:hypothetical protein
VLGKCRTRSEEIGSRMDDEGMIKKKFERKD